MKNLSWNYFQKLNAKDYKNYLEVIPKCSELEFTEKCDDLTVDALIEVLNNDYNPIDNAKWQLKIAKHTDSQDVINIFKYCIDNNINIYLPPRTPDDAIVKNKWSDSFKKIFKIANNKPYPRWKDSE